MVTRLQSGRENVDGSIVIADCEGLRRATQQLRGSTIDRIEILDLAELLSRGTDVRIGWTAAHDDGEISG